MNRGKEGALHVEFAIWQNFGAVPCKYNIVNNIVYSMLLAFLIDFVLREYQKPK